ncbi:MAG: DUF1460 domain-containing protein [Prevotellaceae bacterium]|nr:DUF1460 domain-containing protein [Prevotellaceae bacterium]
MVKNGLEFLDRPYVAHTLEVNDKEELVINCDEVDCTTFVEYTLAMSLCTPHNGEISEPEFIAKVQQLRYRNGTINGYTSRLHYTSEWINNAIKLGYIEDVAAKNSPYTAKLELSFMSTHPQLYKHLKESPDNVAKMRTIEQSLSGQEFHYVPKDKLPNNGLPWIQSGDILCLVSNTPGLDLAHLGLAFYVEGKLCLLHASSSQKKVVISKVSLREMMKRNSNWTGVRVLRIQSE